MDNVVTGKLLNWELYYNYENRLIAVGDVYDDIHGRFGDGDNIYTSTVLNFSGVNVLTGGLIQTENSTYLLVGEGQIDLRRKA